MRRLLLIGVLLVAGCQGAEPPSPTAVPLAATASRPDGLPRSIPLPDILLPRRTAGNHNPTGSWHWMGGIGDQVDYQLTLRLDGQRLTGTLSRGGGKGTPIADASFRDGEISFTVTRERIGGVTTSRYTGQVVGDLIRGTFEFDISQGRKRDWEAKRLLD